jgi:hypothetical protein
MEFDNKISFDSIVDSDPTLRYLIRDAHFDFDNLEHQMRVRSAAIVIAINKWIDANYCRL